MRSFIGYSLEMWRSRSANRHFIQPLSTWNAVAKNGEHAAFQVWWETRGRADAVCNVGIVSNKRLIEEGRREVRFCFSIRAVRGCIGLVQQKSGPQGPAFCYTRH
jgi:hypothetical protein